MRVLVSDFFIDPFLDGVVQVMDACIAGIIGHSMDAGSSSPEYKQWQQLKRGYEEQYPEVLEYLAPYREIENVTSAEVSELEWKRWRVARNWGKGQYIGS